jgi:glycerol kinase
MLFDIRKLRWDPDLCELLGVDPGRLPEPVPSAQVYGCTGELGGDLPVAGIAGDQQAALFGQACHHAGQAKNTYGTGSFVLLNTGTEAPEAGEGLLTTVAWGLERETDYALEASVFVTGAAVQWLRDGLGIIAAAEETEGLAASLEGNDGVYFVPALTGLGSPHWDPYARGTIVGLTRGTKKEHLIRAAIEAMAHQSQDVLEAMAKATGSAPTELRVDGGAVRMDLLCKLQADISQIPVLRPVVRETTALGAAFLAGLAEGVWDGFDALERAWGLDRRFEPSMDAGTRAEGRDRWSRAVERSRSWAVD